MGPTEHRDADVRLRPASLEEAGSLALLQVEARRSSAMPPSVHHAAALTAQLRARMAEDETWVAELTGLAELAELPDVNDVHGDVVGYVRFTGEWLDDLYVDPRWARAGIGTLLLDLVKSRLPHGFGLWVFVENEVARAFYRQQGLIELETTDGSTNDERCPDIRMVWPGPDPRQHLLGMLEEMDAQLDELRAQRNALRAALGRLSAVPVTMVPTDDVG